MKAKVDMVKEARRITLKVEVKRVREFRLRLWIAIRLVKLAAKICNFTYREDVSSPEKPEIAAGE